MIICEGGSDCKSFGLPDKTRALLGGPKAFNLDFEKYVEAMYPGDIDAQDKHLMLNQDFANHVTLIVNHMPYKGELIINQINYKVSEILDLIPIK